MKNLKMNKVDKFYYFFKILSFLIFCYFFLALLSYELRDMGQTYPKNTQILNWMGKGGAFLAHSLFLWLGKVAWLVPFAIALCFFQAEKQSICRRYWVCWGFFFFLWLCTLGSFWEKFCIDSDKMPSQGGLLGLFLLDNLQLYFGKFNAFFLLCTGIVLGLYAFTIALEQKYFKKIQHQEKKE